MATVHITEIRKWLLESGRADAIGQSGEPKLDFLEIRFDDLEKRQKAVLDFAMVNKTLSVETYFATGVIEFDERGCLRAIELT
jgi:hypothetical protein